MKVGDRVRCIKDTINRRYYNEGAQGIISRIDRDGDLWIAFDEGEYMHSYDGIWCGHPSWFEVIDACNHSLCCRRTSPNARSEVHEGAFGRVGRDAGICV